MLSGAVVTANTGNLAANATGVVIVGTGFDPIVGNNSVTFDNGAAGTITSATSTSLTVHFSTKPTTAGALNAVVTTDTVAATSAQVATVIPVTTLKTTSLAANATTMTISGFGFDTNIANDSVVFNDGAAGSVTAATATSLTIGLSTAPTTAGSLTADITVNSVDAGTAVQVAKVIPVITSSTSNLAANAATITINGFGFDTTIANDSVVFNDGAVGSVTAATANALTVTFSTDPTTAGALNAVVTTDTVSSGTAVQVAKVAPAVTSSAANLAANASTITISGFGFDPIAAHDGVTFNDGAVGTVVAATTTGLTVSLTTEPTTAGNLTAVVTTDTVGSGAAVNVATVIPVVTLSSAPLAVSATTITINGFGFDPTFANDSVAFNDGAAGSVTAATATSLTVSITTAPTTAGSLTADVTVGSVDEGTSVQVARATPVVTSSTSNLAANAATITINGFGFDTTIANDSVVFNDGAVGSVTAATATALTVTFSTNPVTAGSLTAVVTTDTVSSGTALEVANVIPFVTSSTSNLAANAATITINGFGFDPTPANNSVVFNDGAVGTVTAATATSLTVTFTTNPTSVSSLTAVVTTDTVSSGTPVQVAAVIPVVTSSVASLGADSTTVTINGFAFDTTPGNNTVVFNGVAAGTVTAATATSMTVTFTTNPASVGSLTAVVTNNSANSGSAVQIATVVPVVYANSGYLLTDDAATVTIIGAGFDTTAANNTVVFNDGAAGTVTGATASTLTVTFSTAPITAGSLTAVVTTDNVSNGTDVQVATVVPVVTSSAGNLGADATTITISGSGFDPNPANNTVDFDNGAVGTVTDASATSLTVAFTTNPTTAGNLDAVITTNGASSGDPVQVATITPVATSNNANLSAGATTFTINGVGFDSDPDNDSVVLNDGAVGIVTAASTTSLTVTFSTNPATAGSLTADVTTDGVDSGTNIQVATITPVVLDNSAFQLSADAGGITIFGSAFDTTAANNSVVFDNGAVGTVTAATATSLTVTFSTGPTSAGSLDAVVTTDGASDGVAVQVATVAPVVSSSSGNLAANATTVTIDGFWFDPTPGNNTVVLSDGAVGTVTGASATELTVTFSTNPTTAGVMTAVVTSNSVTSGAAIQVATIAPVVTLNAANLPASTTSLVISGFGFDTTPGNNTVALNDGAVGTVTAATATSLTVTFTTEPVSAGILTAVVTSDGVGSGAAVQVATVVPITNSNTAVLPASTTSIVIQGIGFDPTADNNTIVFNDGAVGTVTSATPTSLTVTLSTSPTTAGSLTADVTTDGVDSGAAVQVAMIKPVVTSNTGNLAANAGTITINGFGFDPTAAHNTVVFNDGAVGAVTAATATSLTVTFSTNPTHVGILTAVVTTDSVTSGVPVQVATVLPVVTNSTANLAANATSVTINGFDFDTTAANNTVVFNDGAVGNVTAATATSLTVALSTDPTTAGSLTAIVTTDSQSSGSAVQVATVLPIVNAKAANLAANAGTITITGSAFDTTAANNTVVFNDGAVGTVTAATATSLTISFSTKPITAGSLTAIVTTDTVSSGSAVQVATISPVVTTSSTNLAANATTVTINGFGFDPIAAHNTVVFNDGAAGTVTAATATSLTVTFSTKPATAGNLTAAVTTNSVSGGAAVQVATVIPAVTLSTANLAANATSLVISGFGFDTTATHNTVVFNDGAVGTVTAASATSLTVTFSTKPSAAGSLTVVVTTDSVSSSSAVQVATVTPVVTAATANLAANAATLTINGFGFDTTPAHNTVVFNDGAVGTVTASTATSLTVTFSTKPVTAGSLTAVVTTNTVGSGSAVQVATVVPIVTSSTLNLALNGTTLAIQGFGFDATAAHNTVVFNDGAVGTVTTATATTVCVTFSTKPAAIGNLTAIVTTDSVSSGSAVQVATVVATRAVPVVTLSTAHLAANAATMTIAGTGFDAASNGKNIVTFNDGAVGTVTSATATLLTVTFSTKPITAGNLTAVVTVDSVSSGTAVQVATVTPVVTSSVANLALNAASIVINGFGFDPTAAHNTVTLNDGAVGTVASATATTLTVTLATKPTALGNLTAIVTTDTLTSGSAVQVATVAPLVTGSSANLGANATTITIIGVGFSTTAASNTVVFNNGAVGTVTAATATSLTVTFSTKPTSLGSLTAVVTTSSVSSGSPVQVATVAPVVTSSTASLAANATTLTINGFGFDTTAGNNTVVFNNGAVGTVTTATATTLTVTISVDPTTAGGLTAVVTTDSVANGAAVQVATVAPSVTLSTANLAANAATLTIAGFGFDTTAAHNTVVFSDGAAGTVTAATATSLTVAFSAKPTTAGSLTAIVTTNSVGSGVAVRVASVTPVVTLSSAALGANATTLTISGFGFDTTIAHNTVAFNDGAVGAVTAATATSLTVTFSTKPTALGNLTAIVTTNSLTSGSAVQVATVAPVVTSSTASLALNASSLVIHGFGFDTTAANNTVVFNNGAVGTVTTATSTALTVTISTDPTTAGSLTAVVTTDSVSSGAAVQVASVAPTVTLTTTSVAANAATVTISGLAFDTTAAHNTVVFNDGAIGTVTAATATSLTVTFSTKPTTAGSLTAIVTTDSVSSGTAVQVANITPVVTLSTASLAANATTVTINGFGFDTTAAHNTVVFNNGGVGTVTTATATSLTVTFSTKPTSLGSLTAVVTTDSVSSGAAVQVATVAPVVTLNSNNLSPTATTITISGFGFDTTAANNTVVFNDGAAGTVTAATATSLTVTFSAQPTALGNLTAIVTTDSVSSGAAVKVATVAPVVTSSTTGLAANATTITITGVGFDTTASHNTVVFTDGAIGTVTAATATSLTVTFSTKPTTAGSLTVVVTTDSVSSGTAVQVATVTPVVTASTANLSHTSTTMTIVGFGFDLTPGHNTIVFSNGAVGTVTSATATSLTITFTTKPTTGVFTAIITTDGQNSGSAVQVATVI